MCIAIYMGKFFVELNKILKVLDKRDEASHKSHPRKQRTLSTSSSSTAPIYAPSWTTIELDKSKERDQVLISINCLYACRILYSMYSCMHTCIHTHILSV